MPNINTSNRIHQSIVTILEGRLKADHRRNQVEAALKNFPSKKRMFVTRQNLAALSHHAWSQAPTGRSRLKDFSPRWISEALILGFRVNVFGTSIIVDLVEVAPE